MFDFIRTYQLNIMLALSASCITIALLLFITRFIPGIRRAILIVMEFVAAFLLWFDRLAYIYAGNLTRKGYFMVRFSNFMVFFLTPAIVFCFNLCIIDILSDGDEKKPVPRRLIAVNVVAVIGMLLAVISAFTGLYYYFDESNRYQRGPGFLLAYSTPIIATLLQFSVVWSYRRKLRRFIFLALSIYIVVPMLVGILQIFLYGLSITNMSMVLVSILLYVFIYLDVNDEVEKAHSAQMLKLEEGRESMRKLFDESARIFMSKLDERNAYTGGHSLRVADYAVRLATESGFDKKECEDAYYTALLHDIGRIEIPDEVISKEDNRTDEEKELLKNLTLTGSDILAGMTSYPELSKNVRCCSEKYDGSGYPEGLKGEKIPKAARIVAVANAYDRMTSRNSYRDPLPQPIVREELLKGAGSEFDPEYAKHMLRIIDSDYEYSMREEGTMKDEGIPEIIKCAEYRDNTMKGVKIDTYTTVIKFRFKADEKQEGRFSAPAIILFDSYDGAVHNDARTIRAYGYKEYAELWFDGHYNCTMARNVEDRTEKLPDAKADDMYEVRAVRQEDHLKLDLLGGGVKTEFIVALPNGTAWAYIGLTGEHCLLSDISVSEHKDDIPTDGIRRISDSINYIDRLESDIPNIQIDGTRTAATEGIPVTDGMRIRFHTMTLPMAIHVWHCPYIVLYYSRDGLVNGPDYIEYAMIKLNGEDNGTKEYVENSFSMRKTDRFESWDAWMEKNKAGFECMIEFSRKGKKIVLNTQNLGLEIINTSVIKDNPSQIYVSITGDEVALTDIRIER